MKESVCITVEPGRRRMSGGRGESLINLLAANGVLLRSDCGGRGVCRKCLVELTQPSGGSQVTATACTCKAEEDLIVRIPESSLMSAHVLQKAGVVFPASFGGRGSTESKNCKPVLGLAVDLGTTTIAMYLCDTVTRSVHSSIAVKNPQSLCGDDVMSRISYISKDLRKLAQMQQMVTGAIGWGVRKLLAQARIQPQYLTRMVVVGNPAMIHILLGISPYSIGVAPYSPAFYEARSTQAQTLFPGLPPVEVKTFPQVAGFIGGDVLAAAVGADLDKQPPGTLLIDLGTNGELMLKDNGRLYATSCATGPAFEGASLSCGIQAIRGAIDRVWLAEDGSPAFSQIVHNSAAPQKPVGICGSGIISAAAAFVTGGVIDRTGLYAPDSPSRALRQSEAGTRFTLFRDDNGEEVAISQKDIRSVQLGKAALRSGIECLLASAGRTKPEAIIIAGAFGSHVDKDDLLTLGMIPEIEVENIHSIGNSAGAGAIMALCDDTYIELAKQLAARTEVIQLTEVPSFQETFISYLGF